MFNTSSTFANNTVYELKAEASNSAGTDPSVSITWFKIDWNPTASFSLYTATFPWTSVPQSPFDSKYHVKSSTTPLWIRANFDMTMDTNTIPTVKYTPLNKSEKTAVADSWPSTTWHLSKTSIDTDSGDGNATITITGANSKNGFTMKTFTGSFVIDTVAPSVVKVEVDEDGDGSFTDNNSYVAANEQPGIYITYNESLNNVPGPAYYTPSGMTKIQLINGAFVDTEKTIVRYQVPAAINNTTGDGMASFEVQYSSDIAGNVYSSYSQSSIFLIDGTPPQAPIISTPVAGAAVDPGSIVTVTLQNPTDTDIKYAVIDINGVDYYDYTKPYQVAAIITNDTDLDAWYVDYAGNSSAWADCDVTFNPVIDKTAPLAKVTAVNDANFPNVTLTASVNDTDTNIEKVVFQYSTDGTNWTSIGTDAINTDGFSIVWNVSSLISGNYYLRAIATDINGNTDSAPSITNISISKEASDVLITGASVKVDTTTIYNIQAELDTTNKKVDISVNSTNQPTITVKLFDVATSSSEWILPSQLTVSGSAGNWTASATSNFITTNTAGVVIVTAKNANNEVIQKQCQFCTVKIDAAKGANIDMNMTYGVDINIPTNAIKNNTSLIVKATTITATSLQEGIIQLGQIYDFSFADGTKNFAPITLTFNYPNLAAATSLFPNSTAERQKLTVCYWNGSKWTRDKNITHYAAGATSINVDTKHFTNFSVVADYAKPEISSVKVNGAVVTFKGTDEGSGISTANSYLRVNGNNYSPTYNADTDDLVVDAPLTDEGDYPYVLRLVDNVGNYTEVSGVISYSPELTLGDAHNYPNPFDPDKEDTIIQFTISEDSRVTIKIYDFNGDLVSVVTRNEAWGNWVKNNRWGGTNDNGKKVANGTYFCEIVASGSQTNTGRTVREVIKIAVLRRK